MKERFGDIVDLKFTARMEEQLDGIEKGNDDWKKVLEEFYTDFGKALEDAEKALEDTRIKVPDEVSDEVCDICGRQLVIKSGRFGRFLACPGYPECNFTKPIVVEMPGRCPKCGSRILKRTSRNGYTYYACEYLKTCGFMTWDVPLADNCPLCSDTLFKTSGRGTRKPFCINETCENFLPEDKRGYKKKKEEGDAAEKDGRAPAAKTAARKTGAKKAPAPKTAAKKTGAKKATAPKTAAKKTAAKKATGDAG